MKNIIFILLISISISLFANTSSTDNIGSYAVIFSVKYKNSNYNFSSIKIKNNLCLDSNLNSTSCNNDQNEYHFTTEDFYTYHSKTDTSYISTKVKNCNIRISSYGEGNYGYSYKVVGNITNKYNRISILPMNKTIATGDIGAYYINEGGTYNNVSIESEYNLEIRPLKIECTNIGTTSGETDLIYDEPICIKATKGFHTDVYKWRYSYKNAHGVLIEGDLTPYKTEDNGATIYIKGSDFLSVSTFHDLVYREEAISIIPDGADGYNKPLSVDSVNVTAKPSAPFITNVTFKKPLCSNAPAQDITVYFNRPIAKGESFTLQFYNQDREQVTVPVTSKNGDKYVRSELKVGEWYVHYLNSRYINKKGNNVASYSEGEDRLFTISITAPDPITINNISQTTTTCIGRADGSVSCEVEGGTGKKICSLYSSDDEFISKGTIQDGKFISNGLSKGSYYIEAEDENGCLSERSNSIEILEPEPLSIEVTGTTELICFGDSDGIVYFNLSGGTEKKTVYLKYPNGDIKEGDENSDSFSGLSTGKHYLSATDDKGCESNTEEIILSEPEKLFLSLETKNLTKNGGKNGELYATFSGGTKEYVFKIGNTEIYAENSKTNELICDTLSAGEKNIILSDTNGCSISEKITLTEPDSLKAVVKQVDSIKCYGDSTASLEIESITGGTPPYYIKWLHSDIALDSKYKIDNLPSSSYLLKVKTDYQDSIFVSIDIDEPKKINLLSSVINTACVGEASGSILLNANGGSAPYKFSLNEQYSSSGEYNQLEAGYYNISVEDENGCKTEDTEEVKTLSDINLNVTSSSPTCYNINDGTISISINNGVGPYYVRCTEDNFLQVENNLELTNLEAGSYNIEVQDALGCIKTADAILTEPTEFNIELPEKIYLCNDQSEVVNIENERITNVDWYLNNDLVHTGLKNTLTQEGVYKLDFLYDNLCHSLGEIEVDTINKKVDANFLVAAEIPINDDAHLLNITKAENYDYQEWIYPTNDAWVYGEDENSMQLVFLKEGTWNVGLISYLDKCTASQFKTVKTFIPDSNFEQEENTYLISELSIDKSPNNGKFTAKIELSDKTDIKLYLYNASNGHIIDSKETSGEKLYEIPFSVSTTAGEYILLAVAPIWQKSKWIKMIIK